MIFGTMNRYYSRISRLYLLPHIPIYIAFFPHYLAYGSLKSITIRYTQYWGITTPPRAKNIPSKHFFRPKQSIFCIKCDLVFAHFSDQNGVIIYLPPFPRTFFEHTAPLSYPCFLCPSVWQAPASMCIHHCIINRLSILYHCSLTRLSLLYSPSILSFLLQRYSATVRIWDLYFLFYDLNEGVSKGTL